VQIDNRSRTPRIALDHIEVSKLPVPTLVLLAPFPSPLPLQPGSSGWCFRTFQAFRISSRLFGEDCRGIIQLLSPQFLSKADYIHYQYLYPSTPASRILIMRQIPSPIRLQQPRNSYRLSIPTYTLRPTAAVPLYRLTIIPSEETHEQSILIKGQLPTQ
jgi:hypothetical protein